MSELHTSAVIVGGGIAGLTAAASLLHRGWTVTVVEQAAEFGEVGAGLAITANGLSALASLGLESVVRDAGYRIHVAGTMDESGNWLMRIPRSTEPDSSQEVVGIHRQELHRILLEAAGDARLVSGARVVSVDPGTTDGRPAVVQSMSRRGTEEFRADLLVAADGLRSGVRTQLAPASSPRYTGKSSWRGIVNDDSLISEDFIVRWGRGAEFGAVRISDSQVYWYGYIHSPADMRWRDEKAAAVEHFCTWAEPVPSLIRRTPAERLMRHDVHALAPPLKAYVYGRTVLIGDAAHAMVPTMGQGANSSLEDGVCIGEMARSVNAGTPVAAALEHFDATRRPRTQQIARRSELTGRLGADLRGRWAVAVRNLAMKSVPAGPAAAAGASTLSWKAPA
ncbi:FAD-dependent oxidoreductase [Citricoccus sp. GCM10030269]|uniref:FAD-dependent oxidoreductase n=1 Tax=Citricoccus sp. GCM10030269 TaxID=3273388 RepID=UPI00360AB6E1